MNKAIKEEIKKILLNEIKDSEEIEITSIDDNLLDKILKEESYVTLRWLDDPDNLADFVDWYQEELIENCEHEDVESYEDEEDRYNGQGDYLGSTKYNVHMCHVCGRYLNDNMEVIYD